jgi:hypothetical protein
MATNSFLLLSINPAVNPRLQQAAGQPAAIAALPKLLHAAVGATLGVLVGSAFAASPFTANLFTSPANWGQTSSVVTQTQTVPAAQALPLQNQVSNEGSEAASAPEMQAAAPVTAAEKTPVAHIVHVAHKSLFINILRARRKASIKHIAAVAAVELASAELPAANVAGTPVETVKPVTYTMVEGDVTVADFDATTGIVETREGRNFSLNTTVSGNGAATFVDYMGNVHYKCDLGGNCTLSHSGVVVPNAKLAI